MWITELKADLADLLSPYNALPYRGEKVLKTPLAWIEPDEPYIGPGDTFGSKRLNLQVTVFPKQGTNKSATQEFDQTVSDLYDLIESESDFYVTSVNVGIFDDEATGNSFSAVTLHISTTH